MTGETFEATMLGAVRWGATRGIWGALRAKTRACATSPIEARINLCATPGRLGGWRGSCRGAYIAVAAALYVASLGAAPLAGQTTTRVSRGPGGVQANGPSGINAISADGRFIAYWSDASNLVAGDTNGVNDVFVSDRTTGQTSRVSVSTGGHQSDRWTYENEPPSISSDGRFIAFESDATTLVPGDTNGSRDVFVHDRITLQTTRVSVSTGGVQGNAWSGYPAISANGRFVAFHSSSSNLVPGATIGGVFVHDRHTGQTSTVSLATGGAQANSDSGLPSISADGRYVAFVSAATNLVPGDTNGVYDVFVHDRQTGQTTRVSVATGGVQANEWSWLPSISANGRYVAFQSSASNLVPGDTNGVYDVFVHDRETGQTTRVSVASGGAQGNNDSLRASVSADGRYVAFDSTATNLVAGDTNGLHDAFVHDRQTGQTTRVSVATGGGQGNNSSGVPSISADGRYVAFSSSASNLVPGDTNQHTDVFVHDRGATAQPSVTISGPSSGQVGQQLTLVATASNCSPATTGWSWNVGGGSVPGPANQSSITVSWATVGTKTITATNSACGNAQGTKTVTITSAPPSLSPPTATAATNVTTTSFRANWTSSAGAGSYRLDVARNFQFTNMVPGYSDLNVGNTTFRAVAGLSANTTYYYRVRAISGSTTSGNSNTMLVTLPASPASLAISGPTQGVALVPEVFFATATGCTPRSNAWVWSSSDVFFESSPTAQSVLLGWSRSGIHELRVTNPGCPGVQRTIQVAVDPPAGQVFELHSADGFDLNRDRNRPTIVFTHGWQRTGVNHTSMWSCVVADCDSSSVDHPVREMLGGTTGLNKLQFTWSGAGTRWAPNAIPAAGPAAVALRRLLRTRLGSDYSQPIHFVGHSLGTVVNAYAAAGLLGDPGGSRQVQFTALDRPERALGFGPEFFPSTLASVVRPGRSFRLDNYWATSTLPGGGWGTGNMTQGIPGGSSQAHVYNHYRPALCPGLLCGAGYRGSLRNANDVGGRYFPTEAIWGPFDNDHTGVHQWYRWTMGPNAIFPGACYGPGDGEWNKPTLLHGSLNPCRNGWHWSLLGPAPSAFSALPNEPDIPAVQQVGVGVGTLVGEVGTVEGDDDVSLELRSFEERSETQVNVPLGTRALRFDLTVANPSATDFVAVFLDSQMLWSGQATVLTAGSPVPIGPVPIGNLTGNRRLRLEVVGPGPTQVQLGDLRAVRLIPTCSLPSTLCITSSRFRIEADWEDHAGGRGAAIPRTVAAQDSGFFWFFNESNLELVVKVLDACPLNQRFWVFAAGLTNVEVRLKVTDTWTGEVRTYLNPKGTAFQPVQDTSAFATCSAQRVSVEPGTGVLRYHGEEDDDSADVGGGVAGLGGEGLPWAAEGEFGAPDAEQPSLDERAGPMLLQGGRFSVAVSWRTPQGQTGEGTPVTLTSDSGYFWFFDQGNIELVLKVLDACALNQRFWVFAGGLTNVEVTIHVTDTLTGQTKTYFNPLGAQFAPINDTGAFVTCSSG